MVELSRREVMLNIYYLGNGYNGYIEGKIDEVSVFKEVKTASNLYNDGKPTNLVGESGLVGWWRCGDSSTFFNNVWEIPEQTKLNNISKYSMEFDGTDDFVDCGNIFDKNKSTPFSVSFWVNIPINIGYNTPLSKIEDRDAGGPLVYGFVGYKFYFNNGLHFNFSLDGHFSYQMFVRDNNYWGSSQGLLNGWHHVVGTYDGSGLDTGMKLYVDGYDVSYSRTTVGTGDFDNTGSLFIGGDNYGLYPNTSFNGSIDEPAIFSYELTSAQVLTIYNGVRQAVLGILYQAG